MKKTTSNFSAFIAELRRRRVFRVAAVYAGVAFVIIQIIDGAFGYLRIPEWVGTTVIVLVLLGFPIAIGLAWAFDITDQGIVRTKGPQRHKPKERHHFTVSNTALATVAAVAIIAAVWGWKDRVVGGFTEHPIRSIAVLPLANLMGDPDQDYFVEGMHDAIISNLARLSALKVISRTSAMLYKDSDKRVPEIARELGVDALVEGSVLKAGNRVRITAQLIHGPSDEHLWSNDYEGDLTDILALQKTVAKAIAQEIGLALKPEEEAYLASAPQVNPEAYDLYLKAWHFRTDETPENVLKTMEYLEQAVAIDPTLAQAHALKVWGSFMAQGYGLMSIEEARTKARIAIDQAMKLDDTLPEVLVNLGLYRYFYEWDWAGAEQAFKRAITLNPGYMPAHYEYGLFLGRMGRADEALAAVQRAKDFDPLSMQGPSGLGIVSVYGRRYDQAVAYFEQTLELYPNNGHVMSWLSIALTAAGLYDEAVANYKQLALIDPTVYSYAMPDLIATYARMGRRVEAMALLDSLRFEGQDLDPLNMAGAYSALGEQDEALDQLHIALEKGSTWMYLLKAHPRYDPLRSDPRFQDLLERLNFPE